MPLSESPEHRKLRATLRAVEKLVKDLETHQFDYPGLEGYQITVSPMALGDESDTTPGFFKPCPAHLLLEPDDTYDQARQPASEAPFTKLFEYDYPEYGTTKAIQAKEGQCPHMKAMVYNNLDGKDGQLLRGELLIALRLINAQMRRVRFFEHMTVPVLLISFMFSFMGPQHAWIIEAYYNGSSIVMRPTQLSDLRKKDETLIKTFGQWYLGEPTGDTKVLWQL
ncbi:hypothetical protein BO71DRAFT_444188 [Aspergillus ellipticus CBS 707.79]|uniref:Uncharacterized protein n=1 Tax=Aspergillus ellipticus CBS 707.79 TaxID=1448320 RepID=A0A319CXU4_9EURO|nr:hypothetical protein BO71DRAFT_444188 [Aspergillus ellipticus CBS 707.79]